MNRRSLFGAIALSPLMAVTAFAKEDTKEDRPDDSHFGTRLVLSASKKSKDVKVNIGNNTSMILSSFPQTDPSRQVSMAVGNDGNLWLKTAKGEWKKVVTE
jgi:hypothetical protein